MKTKQEIEFAIKNEDINWYGRYNFINDLAAYINAQEDSVHLCIDGVWGSGKTTAMLGFMHHLAQEEKNNSIVLYFDAWKYEHYEHPIYALIKLLMESDDNLKERIKASLVSKISIPQVGLNLPFLVWIYLLAKNQIKNLY